MKRGFWTGMAAALMAGMAGCVKNDTSPGDSALPGAINFGVSTESRAVINTAADMREFSVWGHYVENGKAVDVFGESNTENTGETVSKNGDGAWGYEGGYRFWTEANYYFHALYPIPPDNVKHVIEYEDNNHISSLAIAEYDVMDGGTDLLYAEAKGITKETNGGMVALTFYHLLTRVEFVAKLDEATLAALPDFSATLSDVKLYGMYAHGSFTSTGFDADDASATIIAGWGAFNEQTNTSRPYKATTDDVVLTKDSKEQKLFGGEFFVFPGDIAGYALSFTKDGNLHTLRLSETSVREWEPGKVYRYTFTISDDEHILFDTPTVSEWNEATGGSITIDVTNPPLP